MLEILQRQLLFKLAVCQGIGNLGILKVLQEAIVQKRVDFSSTEIIRIAEIKNIVNYLNNLGYTIRFIVKRYIYDNANTNL